jgi:hypothetical protein
VNAHDYPFSYPELIGKWLNLWAASRGVGVRFEALNAGREGMTSTDIEAIVRTEVLPLRPDLVVYYEGANQFVARAMVKEPVLPQSANSEPEDMRGGFRGLVRDLAYRSALVRRLKLALDSIAPPRAGAEWPKPDYELIWPPNLDEADPDLARQDLPVQLPIILRDLDRIRATVTGAGAELALSSFKWFVHDGLVLDPVRHRTLLGHLNIAMYPLSYRDMARVAALQNRVYAKYAATHGLAFFDVAGLMPPSKDLYTDAVHFSYAGVRLHAWIVMQGLIPLIEKRLSSGVWPRPEGPSIEPPPGLYYTPTEIPVSCGKATAKPAVPILR